MALLLVVVGVAQLGGLALAAPANEWCGDDGSDWLCREEGVVKWNDHLAGDAARSLQPRSHLWVGAEAAAKVTFRRQAFCTIGEAPVPTKVTTRIGNTLFQQMSGRASCRGRSGNRFQYDYYCNLSGRCPVKLWADGHFEAAWNPNRDAATSFYPGMTWPLSNATRQELRAVICSGTYRLEVVPLGGSKAAQARTGSVPPLSRVYIRVFEERAEGERLLEVERTTLSGACPEEEE